MAISYRGRAKYARLSENDVKALELIAQGYRTEGIEDRFIRVENPTHKPDDGSDPYYVIALSRVFQIDELFAKESEHAD